MEDVPGDILCPIACEIFKVPVICDDGFTYEEMVIKEWMNNKKKSPMTGLLVKSVKVKNNNNIAYYIESLRELDKEIWRPCKNANEKKIIEEVKKASSRSSIEERITKAMDNYYYLITPLDEYSKEFEGIFKEYPTNIKVMKEYINILKYLKKYDEALDLLKELTKLMPNSPLPDYMKIRILFNKGEKEEAKKLLELIQSKRSLQNHSLSEVKMLGLIYFEQGNAEEAYRLISAYSSK